MMRAACFLSLCHGTFLSLVGATCKSKVDCSLNGVCSAGLCECDTPWTGSSCGVLAYRKNQPVANKNLYPHNDSDAPSAGPCVTSQKTCGALNTWNGPIVGPVEGKYHMFNPIYKQGSLLKTIDMMHGVATSIEGPYTWTAIGRDMGANPAFLTYTDRSGQTRYSLWVGGKIYAADSPTGPFDIANGSFHGGNPAPIYHEGAFYLVAQDTREILTADALDAPWRKFADITPRLKKGKQEDPFMWIDGRGNWHIINHAYDVNDVSDCGKSTLSAHAFSEDGKTWHMLEPNVEPYSHTVQYADGTSHTYTTLERPNCHFDASGKMTHINFAADLMTQGAGCPDYDVCPSKRGGKCACTNCKYADHAGTIIIELDVSTHVEHQAVTFV
eukprot:TRINITY_DN63602_c0_g1_i1.p1 TRINITY_DN63602_c0_g1~~TRINITY_DN63602_c0_g1_i1.p1  ORF type:complete len:399 (-),score=39.33 TRINITY_DN63602_c0_g1_i1:170-1324(-)